MSKYKDGTYIVKDGVIYEVQIDFFKYDNVTTIPVSDFMKKTNGQMIRSMTDEELACFLDDAGNGCENCPKRKYCLYEAEEPNCRDIFLKWLKEEVDE